MEELNLDFDDDLTADAKAFGQQKAQGDVGIDGDNHWQHPSEGPPEHLEWQQLKRFTPGSLEDALRIAQEVYGETNSENSGAFHQWVEVVLEGGVDIKAAEEMLTLLHTDKENFGGRLSWRRLSEQEHINEVERLRARRHASICAMNIVHAVLNSFRGRSYTLWIQRSLWRATRAEKDIKSER